MTTKEAVNWIINVRADIGKIEHQELWHYEQALSEIIDVLEDAVPVVHGRWIRFGASDKDGNQIYRCSVCECEEIHSPLVKVNYYWNCGALMDGRDSDNGQTD